MISYYFLMFLRCYVFVFCLNRLRQFLSQDIIVVLSLSLAMFFAGNSQRPIEFAENVNAISIIALAAEQILISIVICAPICFIFELLPSAGRLTDLFRGSQFTEQVNLATFQQESLLEKFAGFVCCTLFWQLGLFKPVVVCLNQSFVVFPIMLGKVGVSFFASVNQAHIELLIKLFSLVIESSLLIVAPVIIFCVLFDVVMMLISKFAGRANVVSELMPMKLMLGLLIMSLAIPGVRPVIQNLIASLVYVEQALLS